MQAYIQNPEFVIENALTTGLSQRAVAKTYAAIILSKHAGMCDPDWPRINAAIKRRWPKGLIRVKTAAWKIVEAPQPDGWGL